MKSHALTAVLASLLTVAVTDTQHLQGSKKTQIVDKLVAKSIDLVSPDSKAKIALSFGPRDDARIDFYNQAGVLGLSLSSDKHGGLIVVRDKKRTVRLLLGVRRFGAPGAGIFHGGRRTEEPEDEAGIDICDEKGHVRTVLSARDEAPSIVLSSSNGKARTTLGDGTSQPQLQLFGEKGEVLLRVPKIK